MAQAALRLEIPSILQDWDLTGDFCACRHEVTRRLIRRAKPLKDVFLKVMPRVRKQNARRAANALGRGILHRFGIRLFGGRKATLG